MVRVLRLGREVEATDAAPSAAFSYLRAPTCMFHPMCVTCNLISRMQLSAASAARAAAPGCRRELWKHSEGPRIRAACPNYEVAVELDETLCEPTAHVLFANETEVAVDAKDKSVSDIVEEMLEPAYELMMEDEVKGIER